MLRRDWLLIAALSLCVAATIGSGFYMLGGGASPVLGAVVAAFAGALGQLFLLAMALRQSHELQDSHKNLASDILDLSRNSGESKRHSDYLLTQVSELRIDGTRHSEAVAAGFADLKNSYSTLANELQTIVANAPAYGISAPLPFMSRSQSTPQAHAPIKPAAPRPVESPFGDQLQVSLEPIVDIHSGTTAHYRVHLGMQLNSGEDLSHEVLLYHADRTGVRAQLDIFVAREAELLLRRLRQRDPGLNIFVPIGASTLSSPENLGQLIADRQAAADVAAGIAFEIPHASLAGLTEVALEGLAVLARQGAILALSNVSLAGLDLHAMNTLNVRFVGLDVGAIDPATGPSSAMIGFAQAARASRVQMVVTGVSDPRVVAKLPQITRLASGPCFAEPRRVKREMAKKTANSLHAAA
jgi:EAL domain-containing protein (putative c-di-GMP-specific phosphodiesterase class I)